MYSGLIQISEKYTFSHWYNIDLHNPWLILIFFYNNNNNIVNFQENLMRLLRRCLSQARYYIKPARIELAIHKTIQPLSLSNQFKYCYLPLRRPPWRMQCLTKNRLLSSKKPSVFLTKMVMVSAFSWSFFWWAERD